MSGYFDAGRKIVQGPLIDKLLTTVVAGSQVPTRVLNAGCGDGLYSDRLIEIPELEVLVEIDIRSSARSRIGERQVFTIGSLTALPFRDSCFDLVLCSEVLEHIADDCAAIKELRRVLAVGGRLLITVPTPPAPFDPAHLREGYEAQVLADQLERSGLQIVAIDYCMHVVFRYFIMFFHAVKGFLPGLIIHAFSWTDRLIPRGRPFDLLILSWLPSLTHSGPSSEPGTLTSRDPKGELLRGQFAR
jgi:SAM-dependent methyltransferase